MLDYNVALELLHKYGFTSIEHPYLFMNDNNIGLCFIIDDENYGKLERKKIFTDINTFEEFLKKLAWMRDNASKYNVKMVLDNYEIDEPKIMFLRNNRPMLIGEMFNIQAYDDRNEKKKQLDRVARTLYEIGDLLLVYDEIKIRQINQLALVNSLRNDLRRKYFDLQKEVDFYNGVEIEQNLTLLSELITENGINELNEVALKDAYNLAKVKTPELTDLNTMLSDVWELLKTLECNDKYYQACIEEKEIRNEMSLVQTKIDLMKESNEDPGAVKIDLVENFRKINRDYEETKTFIYEGFIQSKIDNVNKKYSAFSVLDKDCLADFLRESLENNDYDELMSRFVKDESNVINKIVKLPYERVVNNLNEQYKSLGVLEQSVLILCNSPYIGDLIKLINMVPNYESMPVVELIGLISKYKQFNVIKSAYEVIKVRIEMPENLAIKQSVFANINLSSFEMFVTSIVSELNRIRLIDKKMVINSDFTLVMKEFENMGCQSFLFLCNDFNYVKSNYDYKKNIIGSFLIKNGSPVLYSPYYIEFGDLISKVKKGMVVQPFSVQVTKCLNVMVDIKNTMISKDDFYVTVAEYESNPTKKDDISYVSKLKFVGKYLYGKATVLDTISATRVQSILQVTGDVAGVTGSSTGGDMVSQPIVQQIAGNIEQNVNNGGN